jgi:hypothetical protein
MPVLSPPGASPIVRPGDWEQSSGLGPTRGTPRLPVLFGLPDPEATASHRRASFGGANETHRILSSPRAPCLLCHRATDKKGDTGTIESRCGGCHAGERNSVAQGVHARFYRKDEWELCARCHRVHTEGENSPQVACNGQGCHGGEVTEAMRRLGSHETKGGERKTAGKIPRAGVFLLIAAFGWVSGRFLSPTGKGGK